MTWAPRSPPCATGSGGRPCRSSGGPSSRSAPPSWRPDGRARRRSRSRRRRPRASVRLAALGLGAAALAQGQTGPATAKLTEARDSGTAEVAAVAYGLAVAAFQRAGATGFKQPALAALGLAPKGPSAPRLLYVLTGIAVEEKDFPAALTSAKRLVEFPSDEAADDALERVGAGAAAARRGPSPRRPTRF